MTYANRKQAIKNYQIAAFSAQAAKPHKTAGAQAAAHVAPYD